jgi:hypothetical protein
MVYLKRIDMLAVAGQGKSIRCFNAGGKGDQQAPLEESFTLMAG